MTIQRIKIERFYKTIVPVEKINHIIQCFKRCELQSFKLKNPQSLFKMRWGFFYIWFKQFTKS